MPAQTDEVDLPGVTPSRQTRSRKMTLALLEAGAAMLRTHSLSELSIEALCNKVGATVGAFYGRFESKEAYFGALIELAARDGEGALLRLTASAGPVDAELAKLCALLVGGITSWIRSHEGVLRAALKRGDTRPNKWTPFKALAGATTRRVTPLLLPAMGPGRRAAKTRTIAFGLQVVLGTLVNAILNDPGPVLLRDREMEARLTLCLIEILQAEIKENGRRGV
jgi:AcrR family transcriptional regulator